MKELSKLITKIYIHFTLRFFWIILVVSFIGMANFSKIKPKPFGDNIFNVEAKIIANNIRGIEPIQNIKFDHSVIPSLFYVVPALLTDSSYESKWYLNLAIIWNMCTFILAIWLYLKAFELKDNFSKLLFVIFLVIIPYFIYYNLYFSTEPISFLLLAILFYLTPKHHEKFTLKKLILTGFVSGLIIANRPNFILFIPVLSLLIISSKKWSLLIVPLFSLISLSLVNQFYRFNNDSIGKDKVVFLLEQIHVGQFFLRAEFTDWSFFNNEYRENSIDYKSYSQSKEIISNRIVSGISPREAYLNEIVNQYKLNLLASTVHPIKKFIHGNSIHIGSKVPGKINPSYLKKNIVTFGVNIALNIINWLIIGIGLYFLFTYYKEQEILSIFIISILLTFNIFNMISASEQRYLFPTKIIYIILVIKFIVRNYSLHLPKN
jgi:hypothetical protein